MGLGALEINSGVVNPAREYNFRVVSYSYLLIVYIRETATQIFFCLLSNHS